MTGYRKLTRSARMQRNRLITRQIHMLTLSRRVQDQLRDPKLLIPSFLAGLASGYLLPRATGSLRTLTRTSRLIKLVVLPLLALHRQSRQAADTGATGRDTAGPVHTGGVDRD